MPTEDAIVVALITIVLAGFMAIMFWAERRTEGRPRPNADS